MEKKQYPLISFIIFFLVLGLVGYIVRTKKLDQPGGKLTSLQTILNSPTLKKDEIKKITSDAEFVALMQEGQNGNSRGLPISGGGDVMMKTTGISSPRMSAPAESLERSSSTNVQVAGIDEPDIVKTSDSTIFYSREKQFRVYGTRDSLPGVELQMMPSRKMIAPQYESVNEITSIQALPPSFMKIQGSIPESGEMVISEKTLVVFSNNNSTGALKLTGYSVENPNAPKKMWELPFSQQMQKVAARLYDNKLYLVTSTIPNMPRPCPIPLILGSIKTSVRCTDIYMPSSKPNTNAVYSVLTINPKTGGVDKTVSFMGQMGQSTVYMSEDALYLSYQGQESSVNILGRFISENTGIFPAYIEEKIAKLKGYDLSESTKEIEMNSLLSQYIYGLDDDGKLKIENQINNSFKRFISKYKRTFEYTGIIKIKRSNLSIQASGKVPGTILNQFSFDEWKGDLRVATTTSGRSPFYMIGGNATSEQVSDVYVLGSNLEIKGTVEDLGKTERIYSVRFIEDRGYVVTFRQTDPFYVLDLSNGFSPALKGELKIPGYSSYLHPLDSHLILGIGRENQVKLSLFDVSDPTNPREVDKYELANEYYSEALDNHHAFLQDPKYTIFFLPGSRGGYVFSYKNNSLSLVKAIESAQVKRGLYLNDTFYVVTDNGVTSYKEGSWNKVGQVVFEDSQLMSPEPLELPVTDQSPIGL